MVQEYERAVMFRFSPASKIHATTILAVITIKRCFFFSFIPLMHHGFFNIATFYEKRQSSIWFYLQTWSSTNWRCPWTWGSVSFVTLYQWQQWWWSCCFVSFVTLYQPQRWWSWCFVSFVTLYQPQRWWSWFIVSFVTFLYQPQRWWSWWFVRHNMMLLRKILW